MDKEEVKVIGEISGNVDEKITVSLHLLKGNRFIDIRIYSKYGETWIPTIKGLSLSADKYKDLSKLIEKAGTELEKEKKEEKKF